MPPSSSTICTVARQLSGSEVPLGKHWVTKFKKHHEGLTTTRGRPKDLAQLTYLTDELMNQLFNGFKKIKKQYNMKNQDV